MVIDNNSYKPSCSLLQSDSKIIACWGVGGGTKNSCMWMPAASSGTLTNTLAYLCSLPLPLFPKELSLSLPLSPSPPLSHSRAHINTYLHTHTHTLAHSLTCSPTQRSVKPRVAWMCCWSARFHALKMTVANRRREALVHTVIPVSKVQLKMSHFVVTKWKFWPSKRR